MNETVQSASIEQAEWFKDLACRRRSIRGFLPERLPGSTLNSIFETANSAPSNCNTQPWQTCVASGQKRDQISKGLLETVGKGENQLEAFGIESNMKLLFGISFGLEDKSLPEN